jgi:hypothetical protein
VIDTQLHLSTVPNLAPVPAPFPIEAGRFKPRWAFWTSTYVNGSSAWVEWCRSECHGDPDRSNWFVLGVRPTARVYVVDTLQDLEYLVDRYPLRPFSYRQSIRYVDWAAAAQDFDGVQVTEEGQWQTRFSEPGLYGWDCESTAWFRWAFTKVERIKYGVLGQSAGAC